MLSQTEYGWAEGEERRGKMYPWPEGKLLLLVAPLIGAGHAPPCIPFVPPAIARFLLFALLQVPTAPQLFVSSLLLSSLAQLRDA